MNGPEGCPAQAFIKSVEETPSGMVGKGATKTYTHWLTGSWLPTSIRKLACSGWYARIAPTGNLKASRKRAGRQEASQMEGAGVGVNVGERVEVGEGEEGGEGV
jgi:hypothetical protein